MNFEELFGRITAERLPDNVFRLFGKDFFALTAGNERHYNSMVGSGGGFGTFFMKPAAWCFIRSDRYTLELIEKHKTYTFSFFDEKDRPKMLFLASASGRDGNKMKETELTGVRTPSGNMAFEEARIIIECKLQAMFTGNPENFYTQEAKDYIAEAYAEAPYLRKITFGEMTRIWIRDKSIGTDHV